MSLDDYTIKDIEKVIAGIDGKKVIKVDFARLIAPGENYLSLVLSVDILVENEKGRRETIKAVAKRLPLVEMKFNFSGVAMRNEIEFYSEVVPLLSEFAREYGISTDFYPKYLGSRLSLDPDKTEPDSESVLLIENLLSEGYKNEDRLVGFDLEGAKAVLKALAQFHGIPLAIKFKNPEAFGMIKRMVDRQPFSSPSNDIPADIGPPEHLTFENAVKIPACAPYIQNIKKLQENLVPMEERFLTEGKEPWNTVIHNDFWINNMLINPSRRLVKLIDFQVCSYSSYARDVVFFLLTSVSDEVQRKHFDDLLRYYFDELTTLLTKFDVPELKLSYEEYLEEIDRMATKHEVAHSLVFCNVVFAAKGNQKDHLIGEIDLIDQLDAMMHNLPERQMEKIGLVVELCVGRRWM